MRGRGGGNGDRLHQVDRALAYTERTSGTLQDLLSVADVLLKVGEAVPIFGPACKVAREILAEVSASADKVDDVLEAGRRVVDTLKVLNILNQNLTRLGGAERAELEIVMRGLESLLQDMKEVLLSFRSRGWFKRVIQLGKHAKTLKRLDRLIRDKMELAMSLYRFAQDAAAAETQQQLLQLMQERSYALEEAVQRKVEESSASELENNASALTEVAAKAGISVDVLLDELQSFASEVQAQYQQVQENVSRVDASVGRVEAGVDAMRGEMRAQQLSISRELKKLQAEIETLRSQDKKSNYEYVRRDGCEEDDTDYVASKLGSGAFGSTHLMRSRSDNRLYAVKLVAIDLVGTTATMLWNEVAMLHRVSHPHIVRYFSAFEFKHDFFGRVFAIVTELLTGGSFTARVKSLPLPTDEQIEQWVSEIASGLACIHEMRILHRDMKPDNVLLDEKERSRIIDFGLACTLTSKSRVSTRPGGGGTNLYMSPERCRGMSYNEKDDMWALGCVLAGALLVKPFLMDRPVDNFALGRQNVDELVVQSKNRSHKLGSLVASLLAEQPAQRPSASAVIDKLCPQKARLLELERQLEGQMLERDAERAAAERAAAEKAAAEGAAAEKAAAEKAAVEKAAAAEKAAAEKAAAERAAAERAAAERAAAERAAAERAAAERAAAERAAAERAAAEKAAAEKAAAEKAAAEKAAARPSAAALAYFCRKVGIRDEQSVRQATSLDWRSKQLNSDDCQVIAYLIASGALANLTELWLSRNKIGGKGFKSFSTALASGALANLTVLGLDGNQIGDAGIKIFSETVASGALANLTELYLRSNQIGDEGIKVFSSALASGALANLTFLGLGGNQIGNAGIKIFSETVASGALAKLTVLSLYKNQIGDEGIKLFSSALASGALANLTKLYLGGNQIGDEGIKVFSSALASGALANLTVLGLGGNQIGDAGIKIFSETVASGALANLTNLYLGSNQIGDEGIKVFSSALASGALAKLKEFYIDGKHMKNPHLVAACKPRGINIK